MKQIRLLNAPWWLAVALGLAWSASLAQSSASALMGDPSVDELRDVLFPQESSTRSFRRTAPPTKDGLCLGNAPSQGGSGSRNLEVVGYGAAEAPHANLAIQFSNYSDVITPASLKVLERLAIVLKEDDALQARFAIAGHTDATGTDKLNLELSCARAIAVRNHLIKQGVAPERLGAYGFGSRRPLEATSGSSNINRRVEIRKEE